MRIDLRSGDRGVAEKLLHRAYVRAVIQQVRAIGVSKHVRSHLLVDLSVVAKSLKKLGDIVPRKPSREPGGYEEGWAVVLSPVVKKLTDPFQTGRRKEDGPDLLALTQNLYFAVPLFKWPSIQRKSLGQTQARLQEDLDHRSSPKT